MRYTEENFVAVPNSEQAREQRNTRSSEDQPQIASQNFRNWKFLPCLSSVVPIAMRWDNKSPHVIESKEGVL